MKPSISLTMIALALTMAGCAHRETIALLPAADGAMGSLNVKAKDGSAVQLKDAYAAAAIRGDKADVAKLDERQIKDQFAAALDARPPEPVKFVVYFREGSDELTPESAGKIAEVFGEIKNRPAPDVLVVGHTDRVGLIPDNDRLALKRAEKLRRDLIKQGIADENIQASGRGEREPLVDTPDEVAEPRNRRVEIFVR